MDGIVEYLEDRLLKLQAKGAKIQEDIRQLDEKRESLKMQLRHIDELYAATDAVLKAELGQDTHGTAEDTSWAAVRSKIPAMSMKDAIRTIVRLQGRKGIHVDDILMMLMDAGFPLKAKDPKASIAGSIHLETKSAGTYEKVAPNTFRLAALGRIPSNGIAHNKGD